VASSPGSRLLIDLGCGTGELARPLAGAFDDVVAVDIEPGMIAGGAQRAAQEGIGNITWRAEEAEVTSIAAGAADLITVGSAFHWMDRALVLDKARAMLCGGGTFAVVGGNSPWTGKEPWQELIVSVLQRVIGPGRRAGQGVFRKPAEPHEKVMAANGFSDVTQYDFLTPHRWTLDGVLGYLRSTSFASAAVLGDRAAEFERILADELRALNPAGTFSEQLPFYALLGHPDREEA
jgi:SAM-dependent methyltransferase